MELSSSWEAASHPAQEYLNILWNPKVQYHVQKSPPLQKNNTIERKTKQHSTFLSHNLNCVHNFIYIITC
jgi:hypothetical protein